MNAMVSKCLKEEQTEAGLKRNMLDFRTYTLGFSIVKIISILCTTAGAAKAKHRHFVHRDRVVVLICHIQ